MSAKKFLDELNRNPRAKALARKPGHLALMCYLFKHEGGPLPSNVAELFDRVIRHRLELREANVLLFSVELKYQIDLDKGNLSKNLRQKFKGNKIPLSQNVTVSIKKQGSEWLITDKDNQKEYFVKKEKDILKIYANVKEHTSDKLYVLKGVAFHLLFCRRSLHGLKDSEFLPLTRKVVAQGIASHNVRQSADADLMVDDIVYNSGLLRLLADGTYKFESTPIQEFFATCFIAQELQKYIAWLFENAECSCEVCNRSLPNLADDYWYAVRRQTILLLAGQIEDATSIVMRLIEHDSVASLALAADVAENSKQCENWAIELLLEHVIRHVEPDKYRRERIEPWIVEALGAISEKVPLFPLLENKRLQPDTRWGLTTEIAFFLLYGALIRAGKFPRDEVTRILVAGMRCDSESIGRCKAAIEAIALSGIGNEYPPSRAREIAEIFADVEKYGFPYSDIYSDDDIEMVLNIAQAILDSDDILGVGGDVDDETRYAMVEILGIAAPVAPRRVIWMLLREMRNIDYETTSFAYLALQTAIKLVPPESVLPMLIEEANRECSSARGYEYQSVVLDIIEIGAQVHPEAYLPPLIRIVTDNKYSYDDIDVDAAITALLDAAAGYHRDRAIRLLGLVGRQAPQRVIQELLSIIQTRPEYIGSYVPEDLRTVYTFHTEPAIDAFAMLMSDYPDLVIPALLDVYREGIPIAVTPKVIEALGEYGARYANRIIPLLHRWLRGNRGPIRESIAEALGTLGSICPEEALLILIDALSEVHPIDSVLKALEKVSAAAPDPALKLLTGALGREDTYWNVRKALLQLGKKWRPVAVTNILLRLGKIKNHGFPYDDIAELAAAAPEPVVSVLMTHLVKMVEDYWTMPTDRARWDAERDIRIFIDFMIEKLPRMALERSAPKVVPLLLKQLAKRAAMMRGSNTDRDAWEIGQVVDAVLKFFSLLPEPVVTRGATQFEAETLTTSPSSRLALCTGLLARVMRRTYYSRNADTQDIPKTAATILGVIGDESTLEILTNFEYEWRDREIAQSVIQAINAKLRERRDSKLPTKAEPSLEEYTGQEEGVETATTEAEPELLQAFKAFQQMQLDRWLKILKGNDSILRASAAEELGKIGGKRAVPPLLESLTDEYWFVRADAAEALGAIGDTSAIEGLRRCLQDRDLHVRHAALKAIGKIGGPAAVEALLEVVADTCFDHVDLLETGGMSVAYVRETIPDAGWRNLRCLAVDALGNIGDSEAIDGLVEALKDENENVGVCAVYALGRIGKKNSSAVYALRTALNDKNINEHIRQVIAEYLD